MLLGHNSSQYHHSIHEMPQEPDITGHVLNCITEVNSTEGIQVNLTKLNQTKQN
jgi:hypothetical protein